MFHTLYPQRIQEPILMAISSFTTDGTDWTDLPLELLELLNSHAGSKT